MEYLDKLEFRLKLKKLKLKLAEFRISMKMIGNGKFKYDQNKSEYKKLEKDLNEIQALREVYEEENNSRRQEFEKNVADSDILLDNSKLGLLDYYDGDQTIHAVYFCTEKIFEEKLSPYTNRGSVYLGKTEEPLTLEEKKKNKFFKETNMLAYEYGKDLLLKEGKLVKTEDGNIVVTQKNTNSLPQAVVDEICKLTQQETKVISFQNDLEKDLAPIEEKEEKIKKRMQELEEKTKSIDKLLEKREKIKKEIDDIEISIYYER